jgi:surface carbohydrate biosynthesis protein
MSEGQQSVFRDLDTSSFYLDGTEINIYCLIKSVFTKSFWRDPIITYLKTYISCVDPLLVVTFTDNFHPFYKLSSVIGSTKTMVIQNGTRGAFLDVFDVIEAHSDFRVDHMCVFGKDIGDLYARYVNCDVHVVGSTRSNFYPISKSEKTIEVLYISQFIGELSSTKTMGAINGEIITVSEYSQADYHVLELTKSWCASKGKKLTILPRSNELSTSERDYFTSQLFGLNWAFAPKSGEKSTYDIVDKSDIVIAVDSTLGYEALSRGVKTAIISCRSFRGLTSPFGWPSKFADNGPFWSNSLDEKHFNRILDYLSSIKSLNQSEHNEFDQIINFDLNNKILRKIIFEVDGVLDGVQH